MSHSFFITGIINAISIAGTRDRAHTLFLSIPRKVVFLFFHLALYLAVVFLVPFFWKVQTRRFLSSLNVDSFSKKFRCTTACSPFTRLTRQFLFVAGIDESVFGTRVRNVCRDSNPLFRLGFLSQNRVDPKFAQCSFRSDSLTPIERLDAVVDDNNDSSLRLLWLLVPLPTDSPNRCCYYFDWKTAYTSYAFTDSWSFFMVVRRAAFSTTFSITRVRSMR